MDYICTMIPRIAASKILELASMFKAVAVTGPRQTGKTTLVRSLFPNKPYLNFENPDIRLAANDDPRSLLAKYPDGAVFDEVQQVPVLFSYLQEILDSSDSTGKFILTGSNNFLLQESISQSLAGRVGYFHLLPFNLEELKGDFDFSNEDEMLIRGFYPPVYSPTMSAPEWISNYIRTYIERDVRQIKNINNLLIFEKFMRLLAGRNGQELNYSSMATEVGLDTKTLISWVGILESSYIVYLLRPHFRNFNKMVVKRPKLYFYDTGLVCSLLGIRRIEHIKNHPLRGAIFESFIVSEILKQRAHRGLPIDLYFYRDKTGREVDIIIEEAVNLYPVEIKSGKTLNSDFFKNLKYWMNLSGTEKGMLIYAGDFEQEKSDGIKVINWRSLYNFLKIPPGQE